MKLTTSNLVSILAESPTMRAIVAEMVISGYVNPLVASVEAVVRANGNNKIAAIKAVRELAPARDIHPLFPIAWTSSNGDRLGLADSKNLVEHVARVIGRPYWSAYDG
jgi:ribosomal protein L7/L12